MSSKLRKIAKARRGGRGAQASSKAVVEIHSEGQFKSRVIDAQRPVIVDFWAPWCGPCKAMAPVFDQVASQLAGKVDFVKVNTKATPGLAQRFNIRSIPTLLVFDGGGIIDGKVGATPRQGLESMARRALDKHEGNTTFSKVKRLFGGGKSKHPAAEAAS